MYKLFSLLPFLVLMVSCTDASQKPTGTSLFLLAFACIPIFFLIYLILKYNKSTEDIVYTEEDLEALKYLDLVRKNQEATDEEKAMNEAKVCGVEVIKKLVKQDKSEESAKTNKLFAKMSCFGRKKKSKSNILMEKKKANEKVKIMTIKKEMETIEQEENSRKRNVLAKIRNFSNKNKAKKPEIK